MNDIFDIKPYYSESISLLSLTIYCLGIFILIYIFFIYKKKQKQSGIIIEDTVPDKQFDVRGELQILQKNSENINKKELLNKLDFLIRAQFSQKYSIDIYDKSYQEIEQLDIMSDSEKEFFEKIYVGKYTDIFEFDKKELLEKAITIF